MHKFLIFIIITLINYNLSITICPKNCKCDLYKEKNRANCSGQNLIHSSINIPKNVEIFNLSNNRITTLDNESFQGLSNIIELILHHNSIHEIYLNAFDDLRELTFLDLSYNRLEYFDERILENNLNLIELNLSGNKFMLLQNNPLIISESLEILHLKNSQLTHIHPKIFQLLPSLNHLDLSRNLFITITIQPFVQLKQLKHVNLNINRIKCDLNTKSTLKYFHHNNITYNINDCKLRPEEISRENNVKGNGKMFERMIMLSPQQMEDELFDEKLNSSEEIAPENSDWINREKSIMEECMSDNKLNICKGVLNLFKLIGEKESVQVDPKDPRRILNFFNNLHIEFFVGLFIGALTISCIIVTLFLCSFGVKATKNRKIKNEEPTTILLEGFPVLDADIPSPPIRSRRVRRRAPSANRSLSSPSTRNESTNVARSDFATFITGLFERPNRRNRYYRTLNENTARVIRRLSQSNLFNNRLSQHFLNEVRNNSSNNQENVNVNDESQVNHPLLASEPTAPPAENESEEIMPRSETPPPPYGDVILIKQ